MKTSRITLSALAALLSVNAWAATPAAAPADPAKTQYDAERARCMSGTTGQDQASCLRSAGAAYESSKQGRLKDPNMNFKDNAVSRCRNLPASDQADCLSRVDGSGTTTSSGSVRDGGVIKETVTRDNRAPGHVNDAGTATTNGPLRP